MLSSWKLGRLAGIELFLHPTFLLLLALAYLAEGGLLAVFFMVAVFGCILLHEFGHAFSARWFGIETLDITLYPIGGVARLERLPRRPIAELLITLAGPAVNVAIAAILGLLLAVGSLINPGLGLSLPGEFAGLLLSVNLLLAVFNLLPAFPMDGGRILRASLSGWLGRLRATEVAVAVGQILAILIPIGLLALGLFNPLHLLLAVFLYVAAGSELRQVRAEEFQRHWSRPSQARPADGSGVGAWGSAPQPIVITLITQEPLSWKTQRD